MWHTVRELCPGNGDIVSNIDVLGVEFYPVTLAGARQSLEWMLSRYDGRTRLVVTANPIMVVRAQRDPEFMDILRRADLLVPDGVGILWAARKLGGHLPDRVTGGDLASGILNRKPGLRVFFLGGRPGVALRAKENVEREYPDVRVCGTHHGYFSKTEEEEVIRDIAGAGPDVIFSCMGSPRQEKFLWKHRNQLEAKVGIGLGGILDILAGEARRAPEGLQKAGLEWLYRLILQPGRLKADLALLEFVVRIQARALSGPVKKEGERKEDDDLGYFR